MVYAGERGQQARQAMAALNVDMQEDITVENAEHRRKARVEWKSQCCAPVPDYSQDLVSVSDSLKAGNGSKY